jgi:hypothetical protein
MPRPNIQIDDEVREMTEEEYADYLAALPTDIYPQEAPTE